MTWVRLEDGFTEHPKIAALSDTALALFVASLCYSNRNLTDGFVPHNVGEGQLRAGADLTRAITELEHGGLWEPRARGWQIHDFTDYQPTRAEVLTDRKATADRVRRFRARRNAESNGVSNGVSNTTPVPVPVPDTPTGVEVSSSSSNSNRGRGSKGKGGTSSRGKPRLEAANVPPAIAGNVRSIVEREIP